MFLQSCNVAGIHILHMCVQAVIFGMPLPRKFVEAFPVGSSILGCRGQASRCMDGASDTEFSHRVRRRLKRKCPVSHHAPEDTPGGVRCGTAHEPAPEPFARPTVASGVSENGTDAIAVRGEKEVVHQVELPTDSEGAVDVCGLSPLALVLRFRDAAVDSPTYRSLYKVLWTRVYRRLNAIKKTPLASLQEQQFVNIQGHVLSSDRIDQWLALHGYDPAGAQMPQHPSRPAHRPSGKSSPANEGSSKPWVKDHCCLMTWNGDWGIFTQKISCSGGPDVVARRLREHPDMQSLITDFRRFVHGREEVLNVPVHWAFAFEVSGQALAEQSVRVHLHLVLMHRTHQRKSHAYGLIIPRQTDFDFRGCLPVLSTAAASRIHSRASWGMAFFYILVQKIGCVFADGSLTLYHDILVNPDWAFNLLQQEKITCDTAREVIIRCAKNVPRLLTNLEGYVRAKRISVERQLLHSARVSVRGAFAPFKKLPEVEEWLALFHMSRDRYPFLVLEGPSRLGKTQFAEQLVSWDKTLSVDCSSAIEPDLRQYLSDEVDCIIFDEAKAAMVIRSKRLFQAPMGLVNLGLSATNCNAYQVMVHGKRMIVCSNSWSAEVLALTAADAAWIAANSVLVNVRDPLWVADVSGRPSP